MDSNTTPNKCYLVSDPAATGTATTGVNHYKRTRACPFKITSERCFFEYQGEKTTDVLVGPLRGQDRTLSDCLGACTDITQCKAAIYTPSSKACKLNFAANPLTAGDLTNEVGTNLYKTVSCSTVPLDGTCTEGYTKTAGYGMDNGQYVPNNNTQMDCEETCTANSDCIAYDFNVGASACYLHIDAKQIKTVKAGVDHYRKNKECQASQKVCSYEAFGKSIPADSYTKVSVTGILSLTECVAACNQDANCIGLIFNTNFNDGCFKYLSTNSVAPFTDLQNLQLVNDGRVGYKRLTCGDASTVPPTGSPGSCTTEYRQFSSKKLTGAVPSGSSTIGNCKSTCTNDRNCWGLDYNTGDNTCWLFNAGSSVPPYTTPIDSVQSTESHYERYSLCGSCQYNIYPQTKSSQQVYKSTYTTTDACLNACTADATCHAVDFDAVTNKCYFLTVIPSGSMITTDSNFVQYRQPTPCSAASGCNFDNFAYYAGKKIPGGLLVATNPQTADACEQKCIDDAACFSYDVNGNFDCYLIKTNGEIIDGATGENHHHREPLCNSGTYTNCRYTATGTSTPATSYRTSITPNKSRQECFDTCVDANICSGLAYDRAAQSCSLYSKSATWTQSSLVNSANANLEAYQFKGCTSTGGSTTVNPGGCTNQWESFANTHAQGGVEQTTITTGSQCKQACIDNPDCVGVDIDDVRTPLCYLHLNIANLDQSKRGQLNGVTLNVLTRCVTSGSSSTTVSGSSTVSTTTGPSTGACTKEYKLYSGKKIAGGTIVTAVNSLDACKTWCNNKPECAGFDFNANSCWWMTKTSPIVNANDGADHYSKNTKCGDCTYGVFPGKKVSLISGQSTIKQSVDECINACNADSNCQSLTYSKGKQCTTFTAKYSSNLEDNVDVTYYEQYNCQCTALYKYTKAVKSKVSGGSLASGADTLEACTTRCNNDNRCIGFDFNAQNQCWITASNNKNPITSAGTEDVDHYTKYAECGDCTYQIIGVSKVVATAGMLQSDINTWKDCISTCATPGCQSVDFNTVTNKCYHFSAPYDTGLGTDNDVLHFVQKCVKKCSAVYKYDIKQKSKVVGGNLAGTGLNLDGCKSKCTIDKNCIGFDYNVQKECWATAANNINPIVSSGSENVDHYTKYAECGDCRYDIIGASKVTAVTGSLQVDINTWKDCISSCTSATPGCQSVDFNTNTNQCYHFAATHNTGLGTDMNFLHFIQKCNSGSLSSTLISTTGSSTVTGTTPPGGSCPLSYKEYKGEKVLGLTLAPNKANVDQCKTTCNTDNGCVGFDYNSAASTQVACWIQKDSSGSRTPQGFGEQVTHYEQKRQCTGCDFKPYSNSAPTSNTIVQGVTTEEACVLSCSKSSTCQMSAFKQNICYQSTSTVKKTETGTKTWMKVGTCGTTSCSPIYLKYNNKHVGGGTFINGVTDGPSCQSACDGQSDCVGYDISINGDCWLIKDKTAQRNPLEVSTGLTHYSKVMKCDGICYRQIMDASYQTSTLYGQQSLDSCLLSCNKQSSTCRDVIYSPQLSQEKCRFVSSSTSVNLSTGLTTDSGKTFYSRLSSCNDEATQVTMAAATGTTTRAPELSTTVSGNGANANAGDDGLAVAETTQATNDA
ncbi:hypothetical protein LSH36_368g01008 [Paralvinella palmiformis]|uniref:Apple domain-containing protein n=1 Tax=Paralvinella palmiformis TaxID=53620 RepID=A0AAD9N0U1_9ANNE|nr:hypothetical protein LSH36_368g01008 [Paralvinella palmiformis]